MSVTQEAPSMRLAHRLALVKPSATLAVTAATAVLRQRGKDVVDFGTGEPDFDTPEHIKEAASAAMAAGQTKYTPVGGTSALKQAIVAKLARDNGLTYAADEVIASCGGKHSLATAFLALFEEGDEVIVAAPFWVSYADMLVLSGARPVIVPTEEREGFRLTPEALEGAIGPRTRAVILNSPSNPAGAAYDAGELEALAEVVARHRLLLISDDVYERLTYDGFTQPHVLALRPELRAQTLVISSVSKSYAMTGWRLGYTAGPKHVIAAMATLQGQQTSNPCSITQAASIAALTGPQDCIARMLEEFGRRRAYVLQRLAAIADVTCVPPRGAFYVFPNMRAYLGGRVGAYDLRSASDLASYLIAEYNLAVVAGEDFGAPTHIRISYATSMAELEKGMDRLEQALGAITSAR